MHSSSKLASALLITLAFPFAGTGCVASPDAEDALDEALLADDSAAVDAAVAEKPSPEKPGTATGCGCGCGCSDEHCSGSGCSAHGCAGCTCGCGAHRGAPLGAPGCACGGHVGGGCRARGLGRL